MNLYYYYIVANRAHYKYVIFMCKFDSYSFPFFIDWRSRRRATCILKYSVFALTVYSAAHTHTIQCTMYAYGVLLSTDMLHKHHTDTPYNYGLAVAFSIRCNWHNTRICIHIHYTWTAQEYATTYPYTIIIVMLLWTNKMHFCN